MTELWCAEETMRYIRNNSSTKQYRKVAHVYAAELDRDLEVQTREGWLKAKNGDFLVMNEGDSWPWPVQRDIFLKTYAEVTV